jgi:hypothetical protein
VLTERSINNRIPLHLPDREDLRAFNPLRLHSIPEIIDIAGVGLRGTLPKLHEHLTKNSVGVIHELPLLNFFARTNILPSSGNNT